MKFVTTLLLLTVLICYSCNNQSNSKISLADKQILENLKGEWVIKQAHNDSVLLFTNKKFYKQDIFPTYNYLVFNEKDRTLVVKTVGEFGCGTATVETLNLYDTRWTVSNGLLKFIGEYSDKTGSHMLDRWYMVEKKENDLRLTLVNK